MAMCHMKNDHGDKRRIHTVVIRLLVVAAVLRPARKPIGKCIREAVCPSKITLEYFIRCADPIGNVRSKCGTKNEEMENKR